MKRRDVQVPRGLSEIRRLCQ